MPGSGNKKDSQPPLSGTRHSAFGNDYFTVTAIVQDGGVERITDYEIRADAGSEAGAVAYLNKGAQAEEIIAAIRAAA